MSIKRRVDKLEVETREVPWVSATYPASMSEPEAQVLLEKAVRELGVVGDYDQFLIQQPREGEFEVGYIGSLQELVNYVAQHGKRLGDENTPRAGERK